MLPRLIRQHPLISLFLLALIIRLAAVTLRHELHPTPNQIVGGEAGAMAQYLLDHRGFASPFDAGHSPSTHLPPLLPLTLAALRYLSQTLRPQSDPGPLIFYIFFLTNLIASSLVPIVAYKIAQCARWPTTVAVTSALAMCFCPEAMRSISLVWDEALFALIVALIIWWAIYLLRDHLPRYRASLALGFISGLLTLLDPAFFPATLAAWSVALFMWHGHPARVSPVPVRQRLTLTATHALLFLLALLFAGLPWHLRNWVFLNPPTHVFIRGNYALEIWTSIHPIQFEITPTGQKIPHAVHPWWGTDPLIRDGHPITEQQYFAWCRERSLAWIREQPSRYALHVLRQIDSFWLGIAEAQRWQKPWWSFFIPQAIPALLGLTGWALARRRMPPHLWSFFITLLLIFPLPYYFAGASLRYRHPLDLTIYLGLGWLIYALTQHRTRSTPQPIIT